MIQYHNNKNNVKDNNNNNNDAKNNIDYNNDFKNEADDVDNNIIMKSIMIQYPNIIVS